MGNFSDLPEEIVVHIFTRLPSESVLNCKSVSKTWRSVLHHPSFNQMHSNLLVSNLDPAASGKFSFIFRMDDQLLYYLEYGDGVVSSHRVKKLKLKSPFKLYNIVGSCNGLVCIDGVPSKDEFTLASYVAYICNPITGESITLPELDRSAYYNHVGCISYMMYGFGYVASTNEYKIVRLYDLKDAFVHIEVYTLGSGEGWRNVGKIRNDSKYIVVQPGVFVDGFLYWNFVRGRICAFDLANEIFVELDEYQTRNSRNRVPGGHYGGIRFSKNGKSADVWLLKRNEDESFSWSKEFSSINMDPYTYSLALMRSGRVLCYSGAKLHLYNLKSCSSKVLEDPFPFDRKIYHAVPHINTLVSLKAFEEENMKTLEAPWQQLKLEEV